MKQVFGIGRRTISIATMAVALLSVLPGFAQTAPAKKSYTFKGKVEAVKDATGSLTVNGEKVAGWMDAMTMDYKLDDAGVLKKVKIGDGIVATVYDGDMTLHKVTVESKSSGAKAGSPKPTK